MRNNFNNEIKIPEDKAISLLENLVEIPSIKGKKNDDLIDFLQGELEELDCHPEVFLVDSDKFLDYPEYCPFSEGIEKKQKYITGIIKGSGGGKSILIFSHLDTEGVGNRNLWDADPFKLVKKGDKLYGLGSADAKSGVAACLMALRIIKEMGIKLRGDVKFIAENEKDMGATGPLEAFNKDWDDAALYLHSSETGKGVGEVKTATDGVLTLRITVFGENPPLREQGNPQNYVCIKDGINAIDKAVKIIEALNEYTKKRDQKFNKEKENTTFNIGVIKGGEAPGVVADKCVIEGNIVFSAYTHETLDSIFGEIKKVLQRVTEEDASLKKCPPKLEKIGLRGNPVSLTVLGKGDGILQALKESVEAESDCDFSIYDHHQCSVLRFPMIYAKLPTVAFGAKGDYFYKPNEWVSQEEYIKSIRILINTIIKWCR